MSIEINQYLNLEEKVLNDLLFLESEIFENSLNKDTLAKELQDKKNLLILIVYDNLNPVGYKIGFEFYSSDTYFSWSGGIKKEYRKKGLAKELIIEQHKFAKEKGYLIIRTHTKNKYKEMLVLNIICGFEVVGTYKKINEKNLGIILEKPMNF